MEEVPGRFSLLPFSAGLPQRFKAADDIQQFFGNAHLPLPVYERAFLSGGRGGLRLGSSGGGSSTGGSGGRFGGSSTGGFFGAGGDSGGFSGSFTGGFLGALGGSSTGGSGSVPRSGVGFDACRIFLYRFFFAI